MADRSPRITPVKGRREGGGGQNWGAHDDDSTFIDRDCPLPRSPTLTERESASSRTVRSSPLIRCSKGAAGNGSPPVTGSSASSPEIRPLPPMPRRSPPVPASASPPVARRLRGRRAAVSPARESGYDRRTRNRPGHPRPDPPHPGRPRGCPARWKSSTGRSASFERGEVSPLDAIDTLLAEELTVRESRRIKTALVMARLTAVKTLAGFDFSFQARSTATAC